MARASCCAVTIEIARTTTKYFRWLHWARHHKNVKCVDYDVPEGILPPNYKGTLVDVKVFGKKWGPDDKIYSQHEDLRERVI
jgi:hypothetical protein